MIFAFDDFEVDCGRFELRRTGTAVAVEPQTFLVLKYLIENRHRMVSRDDLLREIWHGRIVSDWAVSAAIKAARQALGDTAGPRRFIRTIHGKGFRFVADLRGELPVPGAAQSLSLVVIPFEDLSPGNAEQYFADGVSDDLITDLSAIPELAVASRNASFRFAGQRLPIGDIAAKLGVSHVLEGSLRRHQGRLRINAQLSETSTGNQLWAERFEGSGEDVFTLQDDITGRIVRSMRLHFAAGGRRRGTRNLQAYDFCLRGRSEYFQYSPANMMKALAFFEKATQIDPDYAEALAYQAYCRTSAHVFAWPGGDPDLEPAVALARKAVALDDSSAVAHLRLGWTLGFMNRPDEATACFETALDRDPANPEVWHNYGETMNRLAKPQKALPLLEKAFSLDTYLPPSWDFARGHSRALLGEYQAALDHLLPVLERVPRFIPARVQLTRTYAEMHRLDDARANVTIIGEYAPNYRLTHAKRMFPYPLDAERSRFETALRAAGFPE